MLGQVCKQVGQELNQELLRDGVPAYVVVDMIELLVASVDLVVAKVDRVVKVDRIAWDPRVLMIVKVYLTD